ncbi:GNAT family N-acetyltransferase [Chitinophaga alhagiae]|uniref:GNAT family N-acetyltransferase n=1 Tax=Chitinophaga alhagiae TaxID=2203219 RepID=UPI000E5A4D1C|nr:GNAT family N-acetyltransferase [Chitinophaga alhagiae]
MDIELAAITPADVQALRQLALQTFSDAFSGANTSGNMQAYSNEAFSIARLTEELRNPASRFYFVKAGGKPAGYLKVNFAAAQTDLQDPAGLEIERIYVLKEFHGQQVGQALLDKALEIAAAAGAAYVWLGVWEKNLRAIRFYEKNGFAPFGTHLFRLGEDEQTDVLMKRALRNFSDR